MVPVQQKEQGGATMLERSLSLSTCLQCASRHPSPVLLFRFVWHLLRDTACPPVRHASPPPSHLMQMLRSPGLVQACGARQARLKCDETEWSEPLRGLGSWLRCVWVGGVVCWRASETGSLQYHSEPEPRVELFPLCWCTSPRDGMESCLEPTTSVALSACLPQFCAHCLSCLLPRSLQI